MDRPTCQVPRLNFTTGKTEECGSPAHNGAHKGETPSWKKRDGLYICNRCDHDFRSPYRKHLKTYCENQSGILGYECTAKIVDRCQLTVDHINGDKDNHNPENLITLCFNCHMYKTKKNGDNTNTYEDRNI